MSETNYLTKRSGGYTPAEEECAKAFATIAESSTSADAKLAISNIKIIKVKEIDVPETNKKALIIVVPYNAYRLYVKPNQARVIAEIEKKTKRHVCIVAQRDMLKQGHKRAGMRITPRSRSLKSVQENMLNDIVSPIDIVGKRIIYKPDGVATHVVLLDPKEKAKDNVEEKLATYAAVYTNLTGKKTVLEFPEYVL